MPKPKILPALLCGLLILISCQKDGLQSPTTEYTTPTITEPDETEALRILQNEERQIGRLRSASAKANNIMYIPGGSRNVIQDAVDKVGPGGVVILLAGKHHQDETVTIGHTVKIIGEQGTEVLGDTKPYTTLPGVFDPLFHLLNAKDVVIWGLTLRPQSGIGGTGILIENSPNAKIAKNQIFDHQEGIFNHFGDHAIIWKNKVIAKGASLAGELVNEGGITNANGKNSCVLENEVANTILGIFASDSGGLYKLNKAHHNWIGFIACTFVPDANFTPTGADVFSRVSASFNYLVINNAHDNFDAGYLVIDGANNNCLTRNYASNNGTYDIELVGPSERFEFFTPTSFKNKVNESNNPNILIKDCGVDNTVIGGKQVDTTNDPCF